jgi:hypothetical protein
MTYHRNREFLPNEHRARARNNKSEFLRYMPTGWGRATIPAQPTGEREVTSAPTPTPGTRSLRFRAAARDARRAVARTAIDQQQFPIENKSGNDAFDRLYPPGEPD